jgi:hypothetical protein
VCRADEFLQLCCCITAIKQHMQFSTGHVKGAVCVLMEPCRSIPGCGGMPFVSRRLHNNLCGMCGHMLLGERVLVRLARLQSKRGQEGNSTVLCVIHVLSLQPGVSWIDLRLSTRLSTRFGCHGCYVNGVRV